MVCRLARENMWSVQEIVKTPKREHRARPYRILFVSLQTSAQTSSQNSSWSSFYSPCSPMAMSPTAVSPGGFVSPGTNFSMLPQPMMTQHKAWPHEYPWILSRPYYGPCPAPSMPALAQSPLTDSRFTKLSSTEELDGKLPSGILYGRALCSLFGVFTIFWTDHMLSRVSLHTTYTDLNWSSTERKNGYPHSSVSSHGYMFMNKINMSQTCLYNVSYKKATRFYNNQSLRQTSGCSLA